MLGIGQTRQTLDNWAWKYKKEIGEGFYDSILRVFFYMIAKHVHFVILTLIKFAPMTDEYKRL